MEILIQEIADLLLKLKRKVYKIFLMKNDLIMM